MTLRKPLFLIGFMCSGKTTLGRALACALGAEFIDLDDNVEQLAGLSIKEIFAQRGEDEFRALEQQALRQASTSACVIACGGGTPCRAGAMELMNGAGLTVWLRAGADRLAERMALGRDKRPLLAGIDSAEGMKAYAEKALREREPYYRQARRQFDSSRLETEEEIQSTVKQFIAEIIANDNAHTA